MSDTAIHVEGLGKRYRLGRRERHRTLRDLVSARVQSSAHRLASLGRGGPGGAGARSRAEELWALRDVSFSVSQGEALGVIGGNGAGKSTLLKILSRITEPTAGTAVLRGRVGSLLEVGTGFHQELSGRENVYLNGAILGMRKGEIDRKFDEIVAFAEVERFLDTPVKRYSSGMQMRLAFAVAAFLEPEILLVDEVLAVGDAAFQRKCMGRMGTVTRSGRTVLFVSHNMAAVERLCERALWLRNGELVQVGPSGEVIAQYLQAAATATTEQTWPDPAGAPGNERVRVRRARLFPAGGRPSDAVTIRTPLVIEFEYWNLQAGACLNVSLHVYNEQGIMVFNGSPIVEPAWHGRPFPRGLFRTSCTVPGDLLNTGIHRVELLLVKDQALIIYRHPEILTFDVQDDVTMRQDYHGKWPGVVRPRLDWTTEYVESLEPSGAAGPAS